MKAIIVILLIFVPVSALASPVVLNGVPAYNQGSNPWCLTVAQFSVWGYWDQHGYPNLLRPSAPEIYLTSAIWPELLEVKALSDPGVAWWTTNDIWLSKRGYRFATTEYWSGDYPGIGQDQFTPETIMGAIDRGVPVVMLSNDKWSVAKNHAFPVIGYDEREDGTYLAYYLNWHEGETARWAMYDRDWISSLFTLEPVIAKREGPPREEAPPPSATSVPEPSTLMLLSLVLLPASILNRSPRLRGLNRGGFQRS